MVSDATTFFLSFAAVFGALGYGLWRFEQHLTKLRQALEEHQADHEHGGPP